MLISVHVPKCAGTSFRHVLHGICGDQVWYNYGTIFSKEQARLDLIPEGTSVIHGHFIADSFDEILPERELMTWVRNPVERLVSHYYYFLRSPDMRDDCCRALHEKNLSLREFADLDWMQNMASRYLANKPINDFRFIGIAEEFEASMGHFKEVFGYRTCGEAPRVNTNPDRKGSSYTLPTAEYRYILERNALDLAWYKMALERLNDSRSRRMAQVA